MSIADKGAEENMHIYIHVVTGLSLLEKYDY